MNRLKRQIRDAVHRAARSARSGRIRADVEANIVARVNIGKGDSTTASAVQVAPIDQDARRESVD